MAQKKKTPSVSCPHAKVFFLSWGKVDPFSLGDDVQPHKEAIDPDPSATSELTKPLLCLCRFCPGAEELTSTIINFMFEFFESANQDCK